MVTVTAFAVPGVYVFPPATVMVTVPPPAPPLWQLAQVDSPGAEDEFNGGFGLNAHTASGVSMTVTINAARKALLF
jgi:hypothetical protein